VPEIRSADGDAAGGGLGQSIVGSGTVATIPPTTVSLAAGVGSGDGGGATRVAYAESLGTALVRSMCSRVSVNDAMRHSPSTRA
jgi:hypothetical protein